MSMSNLETINADELGREKMPTLRAVARVLGVKYTCLRMVAKKPEQGEVYYPNVFNWNAVERFIQRRLDASAVADCENLADVLCKAAELDEEFKLTDGRTRAMRNSASKLTLADGSEIPKRRHSFEVGDKTQYKKGNDTIYEVVYTTYSHIVLRELGGTYLVAMSNATVNNKLIPPSRVCQDCIINPDEQAEPEEVEEVVE